MTGIELIAEERRHQLEDLKKSVEQDLMYNQYGQLNFAANSLTTQYGPTGEVVRYDIGDILISFPPRGWDHSHFKKMSLKSYKDRLIIAGALIAAELDRLILADETTEKVDDHINRSK